MGVKGDTENMCVLCFPVNFNYESTKTCTFPCKFSHFSPLHHTGKGSIQLCLEARILRILLLFGRIIHLLDAFCDATDQSMFFAALWRCVLHSSSARLPACTYILCKLSKKLTAEDQPHCLGGNLPFVVSKGDGTSEGM